MQRVTLFSLSNCPVCKKAKKFLDENEVPYKLLEVDTFESSEQWLTMKELKQRNPQASFPTLLIEDIIKGYDVEHSGRGCRATGEDTLRRNEDGR